MVKNVTTCSLYRTSRSRALRPLLCTTLRVRNEKGITKKTEMKCGDKIREGELEVGDIKRNLLHQPLTRGRDDFGHFEWTV
jgi:hypothetical protein